MGDGRSQELVKQYRRLLKKEKCTEDVIRLVDDIVQAFVEEDDDTSACRYQTVKCDLVRKFYGEGHIVTQRSELYLRELKIRSAPVNERVGMCRAFWRDVKEDYGEDSYVSSRIVAPLYLLCCEEAQETEEMRILCSELVHIFADDEDDDVRGLVALCKAFDCIYGDESSDIEILEASCLEAVGLMGIDCEASLSLLRTLGLRYRKSNDAQLMQKALDIHQKCLETAMNRPELCSKISLLIMKDIIEDLALMERCDEALKFAGRLAAICQKLGANVEKPDMAEAYFLIYSRMGKLKLAEKYAERSMNAAIRKYGEGDCDAIDKKIRSAVYMFLNHADRKSVKLLSEGICEKIDKLFTVFLSNRDARREAYFAANEKSFYKIYFSVILAYNKRMRIKKDEALLIWENICNYKNLLGDCEFIHRSLEKRVEYRNDTDRLRKAYEEHDALRIGMAEKQILKRLREADFPSYAKSVNVEEIASFLRSDEILIDYYKAESAEYPLYVAVTATSESVRLYELGNMEKTDTAIRSLLECIRSYGDGGMHDREAGENAVRNEMLQRILHALSENLGFENLNVEKYSTVYICPDGELYQMPFDLMTETRICYLVNAKDLVRARKADRGNACKIRTVSVFGAPDFDLRQEPFRNKQLLLSPLPGTYLEAKMIQEMFGDRVSLYLHSDANVGAFLGRCSADILHIGTHADTDRMGRLYFSGANDIQEGKAVSAEYGQGFVTPADISVLDLRQTRLVVLSACRTAVGEYKDYLGLRGLRRSFQLAGAGCVVAALWKINDFATAVYMKKFYEYYQIKNEAANAAFCAREYIRTADVAQLRRNELPFLLKLLADNGQYDAYRELRDMFSDYDENEILFSHPYYWAGFCVFE